MIVKLVLLTHWYVTSLHHRTIAYDGDYIMAGHAIVVAKDINVLFYHGNAVILTLW